MFWYLDLHQVVLQEAVLRRVVDWQGPIRPQSKHTSKCLQTHLDQQIYATD